MIELYYKHEEIKTFLQETTTDSSALTTGSAASTSTKKGIYSMD